MVNAISNGSEHHLKPSGIDEPIQYPFSGKNTIFLSIISSELRHLLFSPVPNLCLSNAELDLKC